MWRRVWYEELLSQREHGGECGMRSYSIREELLNQRECGGEYGMRSYSVRGSMEESMV